MDDARGRRELYAPNFAERRKCRHPAYRVRVQSPEERPPLVAVPSEASEVETTAVPDAPDAVGAASRFARSMMELVVGTPHVGTAERVVSAGTSIVEFVGAPMRRFVEPAIDNRAEAAQEAMVSLLELTRVVVQEAVETMGSPR